MSDIKNDLRKLIQVFSSKRVISEEEIQGVLAAIIKILAKNKEAVDQVALETKQVADELLVKASQTLSVETQNNIKAVLAELQGDYTRYEAALKQNSALSKSEIEKAVKSQNQRAFTRLQGLIDNLELPQNGTNGLNGADGLPGKDGSPDKPTEVRDKLETLEGDDRLDAKAIKGLPDYFKKAKVKGKEMLVGGIRFFENLADVSILPSKKRQDLLAQYNKTTNRWENGVALTVGTTQPTNPQEFDVWVDTN